MSKNVHNLYVAGCAVRCVQVLHGEGGGGGDPQKFKLE